MPTPAKGARLGGGPAHERLILANLATQLFEHKSITTTLHRAKRLRPFAERLITFGKRGDLASRRRVMRVIRDKSVVHELFTEIAPTMAERQGGYTRIIKIGPRKGDAAPMAVISLVLEEVKPAKKRTKPESKPATKADKPDKKAKEAKADKSDKPKADEPDAKDTKSGDGKADEPKDEAKADEAKADESDEPGAKADEAKDEAKAKADDDSKDAKADELKDEAKAKPDDDSKDAKADDKADKAEAGDEAEAKADDKD